MPTTLPANPSNFRALDWCILAGYFVLMFVIGHTASRKKTSAEGYFLGERKMPVFAVALSVVATSLSVATFVGAPQISLNGDLTYLSLYVGGFIAVFVVGLVFIPRFYRAGTVTIYGYIDQRYGETARIATSCMFLLGRLLASGVRLFIAAIPVCLLMYGSFEPTTRQLVTAIVLIGAVGTAYTVAGGIKAVIVTDCVQIVIVVGSCLLSIGLLLHKIPLGIGEIVDVVSQPGTGAYGGSKLRLFDFSFDMTHPYTFWTALIGATFLNTASFGVDHDLAQRMLTTRSVFKASASLILSQFISLIVVSMFLLIGLLLYVFYKRPDVMGAAFPKDQLSTSMQVYPQFLLNHLPSGLAGLAIAGMFAAAQGSLDSAINAMASSAVADLYWPIRSRLGYTVETGERAKSPRIAVAIMGGVLILFAVGSALLYDRGGAKSLIDFALGVMSFAYSGMLAVFLAALLTRRGNTASVLAALATGVVVTTLLQDTIYARWTAHLFGEPKQLANFWWMPIATVASFLVCVAGSDRVLRARAVTPPGRTGFPVHQTR